jgi:Antibiotic biosynthesis monooxygenase
MAAIQKNNALLASIDLFSTSSDQQHELTEKLSNYVQSVVRSQPGCATGSVNRSLDGERVMCYLQWKTKQAYTDFTGSQQGYSGFVDLLDSHVYEVAVSKPNDADLTIKPGRLLHLGEFRLLPENQPRLVALEAEIPAISLQHPDLLCVNFHRSLDETRTMNYGFWSTLEHFDKLLTEERFAPVRDYWRGLAENEFHLYEIVSVFEGS